MKRTATLNRTYNGIATPDNMTLLKRCTAVPPYSSGGKANEVWHYRVFTNPAGEPILPRGEVYSREFTEKGWLSFSDLQNRHLTALEAQPGEQ